MRIFKITILIFSLTGAFASLSGVQSDFSQRVSTSNDSGAAASEEPVSWVISTELSVPLTGTVGVTLGKPLSERVAIANFLYYFDRDWMVLLSKGDWHSNSVYIGNSFTYYPFSKPGTFTGYFVGGDFGLAISKQTFKPLNKSGIFFFPFVDLYFAGYSIKLWEGVHLMGLLGGGWAPVSTSVEIDGNRNLGDYYPIINIRLAYKW